VTRNREGWLERARQRRRERLIPPHLLPLILRLGFEGFWARVKQGRGLFAPTLSREPRNLPRADLVGRIFSDEEYLRPVPRCDCRAPEVVGLAKRFREEASSDWAFAEAIFDYCRNQIDYANEMPSGGVVGTLLRGVGDCHEKAAVLVALARAGNLPARFCNPVVAAEKPSPEQIPFARLTDPIVASWESSSDERVRKIGAAARPRIRAYMEGIPRRHRLRSHPIVEMKISGYWIPCDPVFSDTEALGLGLPLPRLGYDPLLLSGGAAGAFALEGRRETLPDAYKPWARVLGYFLFRGIFDVVNRQFEEVRKKGQERLYELDETEYMERMRPFYVPVPGSTPTRLGGRRRVGSAGRRIEG